MPFHPAAPARMLRPLLTNTRGWQRAASCAVDSSVLLFCAELTPAASALKKKCAWAPAVRSWEAQRRSGPFAGHPGYPVEVSVFTQ